MNLLIQLVVANLYTKYEVSILKDCGDIFDEKSGERKKNKYREEQKEKAHFKSHDVTCRCEPIYQIEVSILKDCGDIFDEKSGEKEKRTNIGKNKRRRLILIPTM